MVSWKRDGRHLHSGRRLVIPTPSSSDTGSYVCEASLSNSTGRPAEAAAHLTVIGKGEKTHTPTHTGRHTQNLCLAFTTLLFTS